MDPKAQSSKNFILVWIEMNICKPLENCLGLEMIWKLSFNSKRYLDKVTLVVENPNHGWQAIMKKWLTQYYDASLDGKSQSWHTCNYEEIIDTIIWCFDYHEIHWQKKKRLPWDTNATENVKRSYRAYTSLPT